MFRKIVTICDKNGLKRVFHTKLRHFSAVQVMHQDAEHQMRVEGKRNHYDVVIVGGGMVGTTLASAIGNNDRLSGLSVLLLEASPKFSGFSQEHYSNRVSALNHNTIDLLRSIGAWDHVAAARYKEIKEMQVWDAISDAYITFDNPGQELAYIVENDLIVHAALKTLESTPNVSIAYNAGIVECTIPTRNGAYAGVTLRDGEKITCNLLVGADGAKSLVRKNMDVDTFELAYNQFGVVATLHVDDDKGNGTAWQRFLPNANGPIALLPLTDTLSSLVCTTTSDEAKKLLKMQPNDFVDALNAAYARDYRDTTISGAIDTLKKCIAPVNVRKNPPKVTKVLDNSRAAFPLGFSHASSYAKNGVVLIGDAAHRIHPLAGQGVNLGFGDVKCLTSILDSAICNGAHPGDLGYLLKYERERLSRNVPIMLGTHGIQWLYCTDLLPVVMLRSIGLQVTQSMPFLKKIFMDRAMH